MTKEQKKSLCGVSKENRKIILKMQRHLTTYNINELEYEQTITDIIGMALEYEERGESFEDAIGDCAVFCRELVNNLPLQSKGERTLEFVLWLLASVGAYIPVMWLLSFFIEYMPPTSLGVYLIAQSSFVIKYAVVTSVLIFGLFHVKRNVYHSQTLVWSLYFLSLLLTYFAVDCLPVEEIPDVQVKINIIVWIVCFVAVMLGVAFIKRSIAHKYARKKRAD